MMKKGYLGWPPLMCLYCTLLIEEVFLQKARQTVAVGFGGKIAAH